MPKPVKVKEPQLSTISGSSTFSMYFPRFFSILIALDCEVNHFTFFDIASGSMCTKLRTPAFPSLDCALGVKDRTDKIYLKFLNLLVGVCVALVLCSPKFAFLFWFGNVGGAEGS